MKPRYSATSTLNLPLYAASLTGTSFLVFVVMGALLGSAAGITTGLIWTLFMWVLIWRVQIVRRYEVLNDRICFVGVLGSTTLPFAEIRRLDVIEARMLYFLPIGNWRRAVQIKRERSAFSMTPNTVFVRDTDAFVRALNLARLPKPVPYSVSVQRPTGR